ncbi:RNA polymerase sigma factor [Pararhodobacter zhoushanensis]|uniref:RNA polymerase sigma factor n=1 Tax=Pararhodobacter zhoushanensis TaxID=2479545 RepID=UPI000F8CC050|nr:RNA polymerase sigma factor [Pararhodobacter zhoushanensis]
MPRDTALTMTAAETDSDDALLARYATGDALAARLLVDRLSPRVFRLAQRLLQDQAEAEDVTQEALLRLWKIAPKWEPGVAQPSTWLHRVTVNLATDRLRRRRGVGLDTIDEPDDPSPGAVETMIDDDRKRALDEALALLPERQRVAVVLRHLEGMTNPDIGVSMGLGVEAVESLTARGKRRLAQLLAGRRDELGYDR